METELRSHLEFLLLNYWNLLGWCYDVLSIKNKNKYIIFLSKSDLVVEK